MENDSVVVFMADEVDVRMKIRYNYLKLILWIWFCWKLLLCLKNYQNHFYEFKSFSKATVVPFRPNSGERAGKYSACANYTLNYNYNFFNKPHVLISYFT